MSNLQRLNLVRNLLRDWFASQAEDAPQPQLVEACLIRNGYYCGRRFQCGDHSAVWFAEEDEIKIYAPNGALLEARSIAVETEELEIHKLQPRELGPELENPAVAEQPVDAPQRRAA
ncbi:hypothetical protein SH139x_002903 [Planctomycetaceae bacterium SH139]